METIRNPVSSRQGTVRKIALTGGPCGGKSTVLRELSFDANMEGKFLCVPEAATLLLPGFLAVKTEVDINPSWQIHLQRSITATQISLENTYEEYAAANGIGLLICDRGIMDAPVYTPGGTELLSEEFGISVDDAYNRYAQVIHLESLATASPDRFGVAGNDVRYESLEQARGVEYRTRDAWAMHPNWNFIAGNDLSNKCKMALGIIRNQLPPESSTPLSP